MYLFRFIILHGMILNIFMISITCQEVTWWEHIWWIGENTSAITYAWESCYLFCCGVSLDWSFEIEVVLVESNKFVVNSNKFRLY